MAFTPTEKQKYQSLLLNNPQYKYQLHYGGARSGKTLGICRWLLWQCGQWKHPSGRGLKIAIIRSTLASVKQTIFRETMPDLLRMEGFKRVSNVDKYGFHHKVFTDNLTEMTISFPGGSQMQLIGLDDEQRLDKILGTEFAVLYYNEASIIPFYAYERTKNRAAQLAYHVSYTVDNGRLAVNGKGNRLVFPNKVIIDCNPPSRNHWLYTTFFEGKNAGDKSDIIDWQKEYNYIQMNPADNVQNLSPDYLKTLSTLSEKEQRRFLFGEFSDDTEYALWRQEIINEYRIEASEMPNCESIVIGIDPALSANQYTSDKTGIVVVGKARIQDEDHYYVIDDLSGHYLPNQWAEKAIWAYDRYMADAIVVERNQGGDMVGETVRNACRTMKHPPLRIIEAIAKRGKILRAQPCSIVYEDGKVHHLKNHPDYAPKNNYFEELEKQMTSFTGASDQDSPNNLDALVYAITGVQYMGTGNYNSINLKLRG